jgi:hypothetical protein
VREDNSRKFLVINIILAGIGILSLLSSFGTQFWGLNSVGYFPIWLRIALVCSLIAFCIPSLSNLIAQRLMRMASELSGRYENIIYLLVFMSFIFLCVAFPSNNHLLGDGYVIQGTIEKSLSFSPTEPLEYILHNLLYRLIGGVNGPYLSYAITSIAAGAAFLFIIYFFLRNKTGFIFALVVAFCFANMQFFFGYVENYTFSFILIILYLFSAWRDLSAKKISPFTIAVLILAIAFHINSSVYLLSLGYLIVANSKSRKLPIVLVSGLVVILVLGVIYLKTFTDLNIVQIFVPLYSTAHTLYFLTSKFHLIDLLNVFLLNIPLLAICPILLLGGEKINRNYFLWTLIPALIFIIIIDPRLGAVRDWDLLSLPAAAVMVFIMVSFGRVGDHLPQARFSLIIPFILFSILHTGSWIDQNNSKAAGYAWLKPVIDRDPHYSNVYFEGYRNKSWAGLIDQYYHDLPEVVRSNEARYLGDPNDTLNTCHLAGHALELGDTLTALRVVRDNWPRFIGNSDATATMGAILYNLKHYSECEHIYNTFLSQSQVDPRIIHDLGAIKEKKGQVDSAYVLYDRAYCVWPDAPLGPELSFYLKCETKGYFNLAQRGLTSLVPKLPEYLNEPVNKILSALEAGEKAKADSLSNSLIAKLVESIHN